MNKRTTIAIVFLLSTLSEQNAALFAVEYHDIVNALVDDSSLSIEAKRKVIDSDEKLQEVEIEATIIAGDNPKLAVGEVVERAQCRNRSESIGAMNGSAFIENLTGSDTALPQKGTNYEQILREATFMLNPEQRQHEKAVANLVTKMLLEDEHQDETLLELCSEYPTWQGAMKEANRNVSRKNKKAIDEAATYAVKKLTKEKPHLFSVFVSKRILTGLGLLSMIAILGSLSANTAAWEPSKSSALSQSYTKETPDHRCTATVTSTVRKSSPRPPRGLA